MFDHVHGRPPTGARHERPRQRVAVGDSPRRRGVAEPRPEVFESVSVIVSLPSSWASSSTGTETVFSRSPVPWCTTRDLGQ